MLKRVEIHRFRCLHAVELPFNERYNLIIGANGSGKTSLLEALFFLGRGRSFRLRRTERLIQSGHKDFTLFGEVQAGELATPVGVGFHGTDGVQIRIAGQKASSVAELSGHLAPHIIDPEIHKLLEEGPHRRRRFMDFGVFHVEPLFLDGWYRYHRCLKQRNAALKSPDVGAIRSFEPELIEQGQKLHAYRQAYLARLRPELAHFGQRLLGMSVDIAHQCGWSQDFSLAQAIEHSLERDMRFKLTHVGPHRADISLSVAGVPAKERVSRGQQKLLAAALTLAQLRLIEADNPGRSVLLLDDPAAELDADNLAKLMDLVRELAVQTFVTALSPQDAVWPGQGAMFHVEQGQVISATP